MYEEDFTHWLEQDYRQKNGKQLGVRTRGDARSRCKRIEQYEGDLDGHFVRDEMQELLKLLVYSRQDETNGVQPQHSISINGDVVEGTASLRSAIKLYKAFRLSKLLVY
jgi:hypothetical protein